MPDTEVCVDDWEGMAKEDLHDHVHVHGVHVGMWRRVWMWKRKRKKGMIHIRTDEGAS